MKDVQTTSVAGLKKLGAEIRGAEYKTDLSQWVYESPGEVTALEQQIDGFFGHMKTTCMQKSGVLEDDLARELYAEETRLMAEQHEDKHKGLQAWAAAKLAYLREAEAVDTTQDAHYHINLLETHDTEQAAVEGTAVVALKALGEEILARKYSNLTEYVYERPGDISGREAGLASDFADLASASGEKMLRLRDDLARNTFQDKVRKWVAVHRDTYEKMVEWTQAKDKYLAVRESIEVVPEALLHLGLLQAYGREKADKTAGAVQQLQTRGQEIRDAEYKTALSQWKFESPDQVQALEDEVTGTPSGSRLCRCSRVASQPLPHPVALACVSHLNPFPTLLPLSPARHSVEQARCRRGGQAGVSRRRPGPHHAEEKGSPVGGPAPRPAGPHQGLGGSENSLPVHGGGDSGRGLGPCAAAVAGGVCHREGDDNGNHGGIAARTRRRGALDAVQERPVNVGVSDAGDHHEQRVGGGLHLGATGPAGGRQAEGA